MVDGASDELPTRRFGTIGIRLVNVDDVAEARPVTFRGTDGRLSSVGGAQDALSRYAYHFVLDHDGEGAKGCGYDKAELEPLVFNGLLR